MRLGALSLWPAMAQLVVGMLTASPGNRLMAGSFKKLLLTAFGMLVAAMVAVTALVCLVVAAVFWVVPPGAPASFTMLIIAAVLAAIALVLWALFSGGHTPGELLEDALGEPRGPVETISAALHNMVNAFEKGWKNPPSRTPYTTGKDWQ